MAFSISKQDAIAQLTQATAFLQLVPRSLLDTIQSVSQPLKTRESSQCVHEQEADPAASRRHEPLKSPNQMLLVKPQDASNKSPFLMLTNDEELGTRIALQPPPNLDCNELTISQVLREHHKLKRANAREHYPFLTGSDDFEMVTWSVSDITPWHEHYFSKEIKRIDSTDSMCMEPGFSYENSLESSTVLVTRPLPSPAPCNCMCLMVKHVGDCCVQDEVDEKEKMSEQFKPLPLAAK